MNNHVHPALAGVLNSFSAIPRQARAANDSARRAVACQVKVSSADMHETFVGLYPSTADALDAAMQRAGGPACAVSVRRLA